MTAASLASRAEILKLARLLGDKPERFDFLEAVDAADLRTLRENATDVLFDANLGVLQRMAGASKLLPGGVLAKIAERVFGPLLCARIAGLVEPSRGVDVATRLPIGFLADVAAELDPRRASHIISRIPAESIAAVAGELVRRQDWITIGRFTGSLHDDALATALKVIDSTALLQVAFVLDNKAHLDQILNLLTENRIQGLARGAAEHDLWSTVFDLLTHLGTANRDRVAAAAGALEPDLRAEAAEQARDLGVLDDLGQLGQALLR